MDKNTFFLVRSTTNAILVEFFLLTLSIKEVKYFLSVQNVFLNSFESMEGLFFFLLIYLMCSCVAVRGQLVGVRAVLSPCGFCRLNSVHRAQAGAVPTAPPALEDHQPWRNFEISDLCPLICTLCFSSVRSKLHRITAY